MRLTIKKTTRTGKPIAQASDKQIKYATDIINRINATLDEIEALGFANYANEAAEFFDKMTDMVKSGPSDVIEYCSSIKRWTIFEKCYHLARRDRNGAAVKSLDPYNNQ